MEENSATKLEQLEADQRNAEALLAAANEKLANFRKANRAPKLVELKQGIEDYGFTALELFGKAASNPPKPKAKAKAGKRAPSVVKYKDENGNTWGGGKGPVPQWIKDIRDAKGDIEKFRVAP